MKKVFKCTAMCGLLLAAQAGFAHVVLDAPAAPAGTSYRASFRVSHGCDGSPTTAIQVFLPAGFQGAKPMPKPGWTLSIRQAKLAKPYISHGKTVTDDVIEIAWTANQRDNWLSNDWFEEFVLRGNLPAAAGPMWFRVLQTCEKGSIDWAQTPAAGTSTKGLKAPAVLLNVLAAQAPKHGH